jgi:hypothetical protein
MAPFVTLPPDATDTVIGSAVRAALLASKPNVPIPDYRAPEWKALRLARLHAGGVRSEAQFMTARRLVSIEAVGNILSFTPTRNGGSVGPERGYHDLRELSVNAAMEIDDEGVARKLAEAWAHCT